MNYKIQCSNNICPIINSGTNIPINTILGFLIFNKKNSNNL